MKVETSVVHVRVSIPATLPRTVVVSVFEVMDGEVVSREPSYINASSGDWIRIPSSIKQCPQ
jgi:hypothetical protein